MPKKYTKFCALLFYEIPSKQEPQKTVSNNSLDIDFKDFMNLYKKCTAKLYSFLVTVATLASDNFLRF